MSEYEAVYQRLPVVLQNVACTIEGWRIRRSRYNAAFSRKLANAHDRSFLSSEATENFRNLRLRDFIVHCATTVPFYRRQFRELGISPHDIRGVDDLRTLPVLTKAQVQENYSDFLSEAVPPRRRVTAHTSGTTGGGLRFATTLDAMQEQWAIWWRYRNWHGISLDTWCGYFAGRSVVPVAQQSPPFWRYNYAGRQVMFSGYHLSPRNLGFYVEELRCRKLPWLHGYPSLLSLVAQHIIEKNIDLGYEVRFITTGAENLLDGQRTLIHRAFGVQPVQHYGMAEAVANISQCELGALHVDEDFAAVEFLNDIATGSQKIVGTNFSNLATPLLRYDTQDCVAPGDGRCGCGRPGRTVRQIDGRNEDYIVLSNGVRLGRMDHIFKDAVCIREAQLYQPRAGALVVRIVKSQAYGPEDEATLVHELRKRLGDECRLEFEYLQELPRSRTGKLRFVVSEVSHHGGNGVGENI